MKRIISACLFQTLRFDTLNETSPEEDFKKYLAQLDSKRSKYEVLESAAQEDGSLVVKIKKSYNGYKTTGYMD